MIKIKRVKNSKDWKVFFDLPKMIYQENNYWVAPIELSVKEQLDVNKNPFFRHASMAAFLAYQNDQCVGRIVAVVDDNHNNFHKEQTAFFGYFESTNDQEVAKALLDQANAWAKEKDMKVLRGPVNLSTNNECGLLVEGFEDSPTVMMSYHLPYFQTLLENYGFKKSKDLLAYQVDTDSKMSERLLKHSERLQKRRSIGFRPVNMKRFKQELDCILDIYNDAWEANWGFVPMDRVEFQAVAKELKAVIDPGLVLIAEVRNQPVGFALALPDVNQAVKKMKDGKLLPFGLLKFLWNYKGPGKKKTISRCRILTLGIKRKFQEVGLGPLFYAEYVRKAKQLGYDYGEASWVLEDNAAMNKSLERMCGKRTKVYRIYDRDIL